MPAMETGMRGGGFLHTFLLLFFLSLQACDLDSAPRTGDASPAFSAKTVRGEQLYLKQLHGKVVVLYFWADTCCGAELKKLQPFYAATRQKGFEIVAINVGDPEGRAEAYARENALTFAVVADTGSKIFNQYHAFGFPTIFILDREGIIREKILGNIGISRLEDKISRFL